MADNDNSGLMAEFEEFLSQKRETENAEKVNEDFEVEIWDDKGRGVRTRRSHAKPFLQSLGIDLDPEPETEDNDSGKKAKPRPTGKTQASASVTRKYFTKK
jgi:hypothetical protein